VPDLSQIRFSPNHIYVRPEGQEAVIGLTDFGQDHISRVTTVSLPAAGQTLRRGDPFGTIEAIKAVVELVTPVSGTVLAVNKELETNPWRINTDPYGEGWLMRIQLTNPGELDALMDEATYNTTATWEPPTTL
jgi:glycine cleavage system H protein